jgi:hypothetical protein
MNRRGDDVADRHAHRADDDGECHVLVLDEFFPQFVGRDLVHDDE